jgi:hypothetical protein
VGRGHVSLSTDSDTCHSKLVYRDTARGSGSEKGVRLAQKVQVGPCKIPVEIQLQRAAVGPTSGPTRRLPHLRAVGLQLGLCPLGVRPVLPRRLGPRAAAAYRTFGRLLAKLLLSIVPFHSVNSDRFYTGQVDGGAAVQQLWLRTPGRAQWPPPAHLAMALPASFQHRVLGLYPIVTLEKQPCY